MSSSRKLRINFFERYKDIIPDFESFITAMEKEPPYTIRPNKLKLGEQTIENALSLHLDKIHLKKFSSNLDIFEVDNKDSFSLSSTIEHALGLFYVQGASSLLPVYELNPRSGEKVLDICAAPGGKTTLLAQLMNNRGLLVANEPNLNRNRVLKAQLSKFGVLNAMVTRHKGEKFPEITRFDKILVDGPCSSEGTARGDHKGAVTWSKDESFRSSLNIIQKKILKRAFDLLRPGGELVYSTCTFDPNENELVIQSLLDCCEDAALIPLNKRIGALSGITHWNGKDFSPEMSLCHRIYPHLFNSWGFFYAKISKSK